MVRRLLLLAGLTALAGLGPAVSAVAAALPPHVYLLARGQSALWRVDTATGDRQLLELYRYPLVLVVGQATVTPGGEVLFTAINALQETGIHALNPATGSRAGISGPVEDGGDTTRGVGPTFEPGVNALVASPSGTLFALREFAGPMSVSVATGDRAILSQSVTPEVGAGFPLARPIDLAIETSGSLLVMDQFEGLVRVRLTDGVRTAEYPSPLFIEPPLRFDLLADGRIVHLVPGTDALFVFDPRTRTDAVLSGRGNGSGAALGAVVDLAVAPDGTVFVFAFDGEIPAVLAVDPATGIRRLISGGAEGRGAGEPLPNALDRATFATFAPATVPTGPPPRPPRRRLSGG
jgi:hypothetical protein